MTTRPVRRAAALSPPVVRKALAVYVFIGVIVLLQPQPTIAASVVLHIREFALRAGIDPTLATPGRVEAAVNAAMFVPPAFAAVLAIPRFRWLEVVALGFIASLTVEVIQALLLDARTAQAVDLAANATGALVGAAIGEVFCRRVASRRVAKR